MHENNKDRNPHNENTVTKRAEIIIRFDVADSEASQNYLDAIVGSIKQEMRGYPDREGLADRTAEVEGKWL